MDDTTLDDYYQDAEIDFKEVFAITRYKMTKKEPIETLKQQMMKNFIEEWCDTFGSESL